MNDRDEQSHETSEIHVVDEGARRDWARHPLIVGLVAVALFALGFLAFIFSADRLGDDESTSSEAATDTTAPTNDENSTTVVETSADEIDDDETTTTSEADDSSEAVPSLPTPTDRPEGAFVEAALDLGAGPGPGLFRLSGRVPDQETADALLQAAELSYAPFVESDLEVDESLGETPWLATSPQLIGLLPSVTDGTLRIADGSIQLTPRSPNPRYLAQLEGALELLSGGLPVEIVDPTITDLSPPEFYAKVEDGAVALSGFVPSEAIRDLLVGGAAAAYGAENVTTELTIEPDTYTSFWMYTMPGIFQLFTPFPQYGLQVVDGVTSGTLQGGVSFGVDSTEISPEAAQILNIGVAVLSRDLSIFMTVEGHTDSSGPDDYNQVLSLARAESVTAYLQAAGIAAERLNPVGRGESEPIASNDTDEGMALNRRVEFVFGPPPSG